MARWTWANAEYRWRWKGRSGGKEQQQCTASGHQQYLYRF
jgi:hypothetical protein